MALRKAAKKSLTHPQVLFGGAQALAIAKGFAQAASEIDLRIHACSILPTHAHLVIGAHHASYPSITRRLKACATWFLREKGIDPMQGRFDGAGGAQSPWGSKFWKVYIDNERHMRHAIRYVEQNPLKEGKRKQHWSFVVPYTSAPLDAPHRRPQKGRLKESGRCSRIGGINEASMPFTLQSLQ